MVITGSGGAYADIEVLYYSSFFYKDFYLGYRFYPPGGTAAPPYAKTIWRFGYNTSGNANIVYWVKNCD